MSRPRSRSSPSPAPVSVQRSVAVLALPPIGVMATHDQAPYGDPLWVANLVRPLMCTAIWRSAPLPVSATGTVTWKGMPLWFSASTSTAPRPTSAFGAFGEPVVLVGAGVVGSAPGVPPEVGGAVGEEVGGCVVGPVVGVAVPGGPAVGPDVGPLVG